MAKRFDPALVDALLDGSAPDHAAARWLADGSGDFDALPIVDALSAIEAAARSGAVDRLTALKRSRNKLIKKTARGALQRARAAAPAAAPAARTFTLGAATASHWDGAWMSAPDPDGYIQIVVAWADADMVSAIFGMIGGAEGAREADVRPASRTQLRRIGAELADEGVLRSIPLTTAIWLWQEADAIYRGVNGRGIEGWEEFSKGLPDGMLNSARMLSPFRGMPSEIPASGVPAAHDLMQVMNSHAWNTDAGRIAAASYEFLEFQQSELEISDQLREERTQEIAAKAADALVDDDTRGTIQRRMEKAALYFQACGWPEPAGDARLVALAMEQGLRGSQVPYLRALAMSQIEHGLAEVLGYSHDHLHRHDHRH